MCMYLLFSCSVVSDFLWPSGLKHTRLCSLLPSPGACSNSCPLSQWYHPNILSSVIPFSCLQSFPASRSFLMSLQFTSGGQILELQLQRQSFQWIFRIDFLYDRLLWSPCCPSESPESSPAPHFEGTCVYIYVCILLVKVNVNEGQWESIEIKIQK